LLQSAKVFYFLVDVKDTSAGYGCVLSIGLPVLFQFCPPYMAPYRLSIVKNTSLYLKSFLKQLKPAILPKIKYPLDFYRLIPYYLGYMNYNGYWLLAKTIPHIVCLGIFCS
jgi:hypothetical protein